MAKVDAIKIRYSYFDGTHEDLVRIGKKELKELNMGDARILIQKLYPDKMVGSGLFDPILIFDIQDDGKRIDPPELSFRSLDSPSNENESEKTLLERMYDYLKEQKIETDQSWKKIITKIRERDGEQK